MLLSRTMAAKQVTSTRPCTSGQEKAANKREILSKGDFLSSEEGCPVMDENQRNYLGDDWDRSCFIIVLMAGDKIDEDDRDSSSTSHPAVGLAMVPVSEKAEGAADLHRYRRKRDDPGG